LIVAVTGHDSVGKGPLSIPPNPPPVAIGYISSDDDFEDAVEEQPGSGSLDPSDAAARRAAMASTLTN